MDIRKIYIILLPLIPLSFAMTRVVDFCLADFKYPVGPAGYLCRNPAKVTADDFVYSGLGVPGNTTENILDFATTFAIDTTFPALNGLGISMARLDIGVGGVVPFHSHRVSEVMFIVQGTIIAGFISSDHTQKPYYKTLKRGDVMIFPRYLPHFQVNVGTIPAIAFSSLNSASPGFHTSPISLGANDLPTEIAEKLTLLDAHQVRNLKNLLGSDN